VPDHDEARRLFYAAQTKHAAGEIAAALKLARQAMTADPEYAEPIEHIANVLITRQRKYAEGLNLIDQAVELCPDDAGMWYAHGWCYEFAAHELRRRSLEHIPLDPHTLLETAATSFRRCLELHPSGKLFDDATDLLDHIENELQNT
jgi:tetratricopeptide (TPR) repeat protein